MALFVTLIIGFGFGLFLGSAGMFLLIKETEMDKVIARQVENEIDIDDPWEAEELPEPKEEIKYGRF